MLPKDIETFVFSSQVQQVFMLMTDTTHGALQQHGAILRSEYHRKQQRKKFPKARCCEP
jgi:hypothetical protein